MLYLRDAISAKTIDGDTVSMFEQKEDLVTLDTFEKAMGLHWSNHEFVRMECGKEGRLRWRRVALQPHAVRWRWKLAPSPRKKNR